METRAATTEFLVQEPLYEKLRQRLLDYIEKERPRLLPSEKVLIQRYGVSRNTVRRAVAALTEEGFLRPVQGLGTLVYPPAEVAGGSALLVVIDCHWHHFQQEAFRRLMERLEQYRLHALVLMIDRERFDAERFEEMLRKADGVVIDQMASFSADLVRRIQARRKKHVCLRWSPTDNEDVNFVAEDIPDAYTRMTRHLVERGCRRIAYIGNLDCPWRVPGMTAALDEAGLALDRRLAAGITVGYRREGFQAAGELLVRRRKFDAVVCHNDDVALGVQEKLLMSGVDIPGDVMMTGFDNLPDSADFPVPLTTAGARMDELVNRALAYMLDKDNHDQPLRLHVKAELVERRSTLR